MAKKINHRGHGGHGELLFSLCPLCALWFSEAHFQKIIKNLMVNENERVRVIISSSGLVFFRLPGFSLQNVSSVTALI